MPNDPNRRHDAAPDQPSFAGEAEQHRKRTENRQLEAKAAARASLQGEEEALRNQVGDNPNGPPNADETPPTANNGTMRPARGEIRASPDEEKTRLQSEESRRGE